MTGPLIWGIVLLSAALVLFMLEVFVPSGGLIGLTATVCLATGIVMMFRVDTTVGLVTALLSVIALPFLFALAIKLWPNTPIGRLLTLQTRQQRLTEPTRGTSSKSGELVGARGQALTDLRPVGTCSINGKRTECLASGGVIDAGSSVRVVSVDGMQVKVRVDSQA